MSTFNTYPYASLQAQDAVTAKMMFSDGPDKDAFYRLRTSTPRSVFEGSTIYDANTAYFDNDVTAGASITGPGTDASMVLTVNAGSTLNAYAARQSHFYAHYQPGKSFLAYFSFTFGAPVVGLVKRVGWYDVDNNNANVPLNGILLEQSATGLSWSVYKGDGTAQNVAQSSWNVDPLNGAGASGLTLDAQNNLLAFIDLEWLGVGRVRVGFFVNGVPVVCHAFTNAQFTVPYVNNPLFPIRYEIRRVVGTPTLVGSFRAICCAMISEAGFDAIGTVRSLISPTILVSQSAQDSILSIRLQPGRTSGYPRAQLIPISLEMASDIGGNATAFYHLYLWRPSSTSAVPAGWLNVSTTLGGAGSFAQYNTSTAMYTAMSTDVSTNNAFCVQIDEGSVSSTSKSSFQYVARSLNIAQSNVDRDLTDILVVVIRNTTPNSRNFTALLTWREI